MSIIQDLDLYINRTFMFNIMSVFDNVFVFNNMFVFKSASAILTVHLTSHSSAPQAPDRSLHVVEHEHAVEHEHVVDHDHEVEHGRLVHT